MPDPNEFEPYIRARQERFQERRLLLSLKSELDADLQMVQ